MFVKKPKTFYKYFFFLLFLVYTLPHLCLVAPTIIWLLSSYYFILFINTFFILHLCVLRFVTPRPTVHS